MAVIGVLSGEEEEKALQLKKEINELIMEQLDLKRETEIIAFGWSDIEIINSDLVEDVKQKDFYEAWKDLQVYISALASHG